MDKREFLDMMDELLEVPAGSLTGAETLDGLETWDSLALISFMAVVNERTGIILSPKSLAACSSVDDLMALVIPA